MTSKTRNGSALALLILAACGGGAGTDKPATSPAAECPDVAAQPSSNKTDPDILLLAEQAKTCKFERASFDSSCPAYKAWWNENEDLFEGPDGNATILSMLESEDIRMRVLAIDQGFESGRSFFGDKATAERLLKVISKEGEPRILTRLGRFTAFINAEKLGLEDALTAFTKHPQADFREAVASSTLPLQPTAFSLELTKKFMDDADNSVKRAALAALSGNGRTRASAALCTTLEAQLTRTDDLLAEALEAGATSKCQGMQEATLAELEKQAKKPESKLSDFRSPISSLCWGWKTDEKIKKRTFDSLLALFQRSTDSWDKRSALYLFRSCDPARAKGVITPLLQDKDEEVRKEAQDELTRIDDDLKRADQ